MEFARWHGNKVQGAETSDACFFQIKWKCYWNVCLRRWGDRSWESRMLGINGSVWKASFLFASISSFGAEQHLTKLQCKGNCPEAKMYSRAWWFDDMPFPHLSTKSRRLLQVFAHGFFCDWGGGMSRLYSFSLSFVSTVMRLMESQWLISSIFGPRAFQT